ncbi:hypothetical protein LSM04_001056 [Trypanosoma melophagium]|uniref:uncharacterized protein n=1 Tax=Trypanosoma melophagium TaxID=715481 RepID=UPI00351A446C|nr:hypothetical protein LSM04_001056 [Trypanosoma melophagium]
MSSVILADVESKMNEVRDRLKNLSITLNCNEATTTTMKISSTTSTPVLNTRVKGRDERNTHVLTERNVNEGRGQKSDISTSTGGLDRLVELAKREASHRQNNINNNNNSNNINKNSNVINKHNDSIPSERGTQPVNNREAQNTSCAVSEKSLTGLEAHTYYETTCAAPQSQYTHHIIPTAFSNVTVQPTNVMAKRPAVPFQTSAERFAKIHKSTPTFQLRTGMPATSGTFDPFQAVQARLREKLRKSVVCSTTDSSPVDSAKSPSPDLKNVWQSAPSETQTSPRGNSLSDGSPNATQIWTDETQRQQEEQEGKNKSAVSRSPSVRAAAAAIRNVKEHFSSTAMNRVSRCSSSRSSAVGEHRHQQYHPHQQQQQRREREREKIPRRSSARPVEMNVQPRSSSIQRREKSIVGTVHQVERQSTPRRPSSVNSRRSSPSFRAQSPIPLKTAPQRTVLDVLTGAEVFALLRLRGVLVSRGDTGECALPETRCHSMYLSPEEHKQLVELRARLRLRSSSSSSAAAKTSERQPSSARGPTSTSRTTTTRTTAAFDRASHPRRTTTSLGGLPQW